MSSLKLVGQQIAHAKMEGRSLQNQPRDVFHMQVPDRDVHDEVVQTSYCENCHNTNFGYFFYKYLNNMVFFPRATSDRLCFVYATITLNDHAKTL